MVCSDCEPLARKLELALKRIDVLEKLVTRLEARLALYENPNTPPSQRHFPERKTREEPSGRLGRPPGYEGSTRPRPQPDKIEVVHASNCSECGGLLNEPAGYSTIVVEEIPEPQPVIVTEFKLAYYQCPHCGTDVTATHADCPKEGVFGYRAMAQVALLKYQGRLPCKLVCTALKRDYGLAVTPATILAVNGRVADSLEPEYEKILFFIQAAKVLHVDETGLRVGGVNYWIWVFTTPTETLIVIRPSRAKKVLREILGDDFEGLIVCDGLKSYTNFTDNIQRCWAHLLRETKFAAEKTREAKPFHNALKRLYHNLTKSLESDPPPSERQRLSRNALLTLRRWLARKWKEKPTLKAVGYLRNGMRHWLTFITTLGVEPTNNRAERALREHVVIRKIIGTLRNEEGVRQHQVITSVLATCHQRQPEENPRKYLMQALRAS